MTKNARTVRRLRNRRRQRGAAMLETVLATAVLLLAFFGMIQLYSWMVSQLFCEYAAFYASKGVALGYNYKLAHRAARVAAAAISGPNRSSGDGYGGDEYRRLSRYMTDGDASGVWYEYWAADSSATDPELRLYGSLPDDEAVSTVRLENAPLLAPNIAGLFGVCHNPSPEATVTTYNYSKLYLE